MIEGPEESRDGEQTSLFAIDEEEEAPGQTSLFDAAEIPEVATAETEGDDEVQTALFGEANDFHTVWREWQGMPEFSMEDQMPWYQVVVNFDNPKDLVEFGTLLGQVIHPTQRRTASIWFPKQLRFGPKAVDKRYRDPQDEDYWRRIPHGTRKDPNA